MNRYDVKDLGKAQVAHAKQSRVDKLAIHHKPDTQENYESKLQSFLQLQVHV